MTVYIGVLGDSGSGKTTLIEQVISTLSANGFKVGAVKHSSHDLFDLERKDTRRFRRAGADVVVGFSRSETIIVKERGSVANLATIHSLIQNNVDVMIIEGFRSLVLADGRILKIILAKNPENLRKFASGPGRTIAVVSNNNARFKSLPKGAKLVSKDETGILVQMLEAEVSKALSEKEPEPVRAKPYLQT
ncbi:MAG TPA: molybdopterin-guanine dinucleotide biosynthesis protein B [Nitrososphaerales archaeon]